MRLVANARTYPDNDPASPPVHDLLRDLFEERWGQGKLSELWTDEDIQALLQLLSPYLTD